jgi:hypothetical protein
MSNDATNLPAQPASTDHAFEVREKLAQLEQALLDKTPNMPVLLRDIHRTLKADPDVVTILSEEECSILVRGLSKQTATAIATKAVKKAPKKALSKLTVDDL